MKNLLLPLTFIGWGTMIADAQKMSAADAMKSMNKIKLDSKYISASGTSTNNYEEARDNALAVLRLEVQNWLQETKQSNTSSVMMPTKDRCMTIETQRGNLYRVFVYVSKKSIISMEEDEEEHLVVMADNPSIVTTSSIANKEDMTTTITSAYTHTPFEQEILKVKRATEIESFVKQSCILRYGKYINRPSTGTYYLLVYNQEGEIPAYLKFDNGTLTNVVTGEEDTFENYKGCGAYWFIKK